MEDTHRFLLGKLRDIFTTVELNPLPIVYALEDAHELHHFHVLRILEEDTTAARLQLLLDILNSRGVAAYYIFKLAVRSQSPEIATIMDREEEIYKLPDGT